MGNILQVKDSGEKIGLQGRHSDWKNTLKRISQGKVIERDKYCGGKIL